MFGYNFRDHLGNHISMFFFYCRLGDILDLEFGYFKMELDKNNYRFSYLYHDYKNLQILLANSISKYSNSRSDISKSSSKPTIKKTCLYGMVVRKSERVNPRFLTIIM